MGIRGMVFVGVLACQLGCRKSQLTECRPEDEATTKALFANIDPRHIDHSASFEQHDRAPSPLPLEARISWELSPVMVDLLGIRREMPEKRAEIDPMIFAMLKYECRGPYSASVTDLTVYDSLLTSQTVGIRLLRCLEAEMVTGHVLRYDPSSKTWKERATH